LYVIGPPLFRAAQEKLQTTKRVAGYGIHSEGALDWDGSSDAFSQYVPSMVQTPALEKQCLTSQEIVSMPGYEYKGLMSLLSIPLLGYYGAGNWLEHQKAPVDALRESRTLL
jgi:hypothetical protein